MILYYYYNCYFYFNTCSNLTLQQPPNIADHKTQWHISKCIAYGFHNEHKHTSKCTPVDRHTCTTRMTTSACVDIWVVHLTAESGRDSFWLQTRVPLRNSWKLIKQRPVNKSRTVCNAPVLVIISYKHILHPGFCKGSFCSFQWFLLTSLKK